jgi:antitoxin ParD1/3/4
MTGMKLPRQHADETEDFLGRSRGLDRLGGLHRGFGILVEPPGWALYLGPMARRAPLMVSIPPELEEFVSSRVASGRYHSARDVVSEGLRLLEKLELADEAHLQSLRPAIAIGLEQARRGELLDGDEVFKSLEDRIRSKSDPAG